MSSSLLLLLACTRSTPSDDEARGGPFRALVDPDGTVHLADDLLVRTTGLGRGGASRPIEATQQRGAVCGTRECFLLETVNTVEWWIDEGDSFEQGWTIQSAPAGIGDVTISLSIGGGAVSASDTAASVRTHNGDVWQISGLRAWDAEGTPLPSRFQATSGGLQVIVTDNLARYPIQIDPVYSHPDYVLGDEDAFAYAVAGGGDVNGDGYDDIVASNYGFRGDTFVYLGTATGVETVASSTVHYNLSPMEVPTAIAGDVNADGYDDVMVCVAQDERINVYAGSSVGLAADPAWTLPDNIIDWPYYSREVASVAGAGDVNADGYDDLIVGSPDSVVAGRATVYLGSASGPVDDAGVELRADSAPDSYDTFGYSVAGGGDVNGDGYDDVIVGAATPYTAVYYGSVSGVSDAAKTILDTHAGAVAFSVAGAGDVNGDGYDDVLVGAVQWSEGGEPWDDRGEVRLFLGGPEGVTATPDWVREGALDDTYYGSTVAGMGDANGDGYSDVIVIGTYQGPDIYLGSATGLDADPVATLVGDGGYSVSGAGDVDRDGLDDVVIGGGAIFLASNFLDTANADPDTGGDTDADSDTDSDTDTDTDTDTDADTDSDTDSDGDTGAGGDPGGCGGGKAGCSTTTVRPESLPFWAITLAFALKRRTLRKPGAGNS